MKQGHRKSGLRPKKVKNGILGLPNRIEWEDVCDLDLRKELMIDPSRLDEELMEHAAKFSFVSTMEALATMKAGEAEDRMNRKAAELRSKIRLRWEKAGEKVTEHRLDNAVMMNKEYQRMRSEYRKAIFRRDVLTGARRAFADRGENIRELVRNQRREFMESVDYLK